MSSNSSQSSLDKKEKKIKIDFLAVFLFLIVLAVFVFGSIFSYLVWENLRPASVLSISGEAYRKVTPKQIILSFNLEEKGPDLQTLNKNADEKTSKIVQYLEQELKISRSKIKINKNSQPVTIYSYSYPSNGTDKYEQILNVYFEVNLENLQNSEQKSNEILQKLTSLGVTKINPITFTIPEEEKEKICQELQTEAINKASEKAKNYILSLKNAKIVKEEIDANSYLCNRNYYSTYREESGSSAGTTNSTVLYVNPGEQEISARVELRVTYRIYT